jgi:adenylate cyclase
MRNFIIAVLIAAFYLTMDSFFKPESLTKFNNNFIDMFFNIRGELPVDERIAIIDIDEKSLGELGQWPWSRDTIATILDNLNSAGVGAIGLDMVFAEKDRTGEENDKILATTLARTPTILGFVLDFEQGLGKEAPKIPVSYIKENEMPGFIPEAVGVVPNLKVMQESAYSSGFFNMFPDVDGIVRYVPMVFEYKGQIYPSLSFEMMRAAIGEDTVFIEYDGQGVQTISFGGMNIPTDKFGRLFVNYRGAGFSYPYISALDIYNNTFEKKEIEGKMVLLGTSASGLKDIRHSPYDTAIPGVEIHANVLDNLMNETYLKSPSYEYWINSPLIFFSALLLGFMLSRLSALMSILFSVLYIIGLMAGLYYVMFELGLVLNVIYPILTVLTTLIVLFFVNYYIENKQKQVIIDKFSRKVSPAVANELIKSGQLEFQGSTREVTIFFSDVRSFTTISESFESAYGLIQYLNEYMSPMSEIIIESGGTIDKYIGDAIMAYWNAPLDVEEHADRAVMASIKQIEALDPLNEKLLKESKPRIEIGIGLHTGEAVVGEMGSMGRSDYTIIGDNVNLGSRIEGLCKPYGAKILISETTHAQLKGTYKIRFVDNVTVKGKERPVKLYEVLGSGSFSSAEQKELHVYDKAHALYDKEEYAKAKEVFELLNERRPHKLYAMYAERCQQLVDGEVKMENGVFKHVTK